MNLYQATRCFNRDSLFGIGSRLTAGRPKNRHSVPGRGRRVLPLSNFPDRLWSSPNLLFRGHGVSSQSVKRRRRETDHSPLSSVQIEKHWSFYLQFFVRLQTVRRDSFSSTFISHLQLHVSQNQPLFPFLFRFIKYSYKKRKNRKWLRTWNDEIQLAIEEKKASYRKYLQNKTVEQYTGCPRRNVQYFGRVFLMLNYTDITQNTYIQS